ncbi:MAG TPA: cupin domain-containing protein [Nevskiaceae bacterium]|nr:cupin domain-containing protein [Nevskiaceae bacterium]
MYVIHEPSEHSFDKVGIQGKIFPARGLTESLNFVRISTETGHETKIIEHESTFCYYVLEGEGYFEINDQREDCAKGDLVVIPAGAPFIYKGKLEMLLVNNPPWREEQEETIS